MFFSTEWWYQGWAIKNSVLAMSKSHELQLVQFLSIIVVQLSCSTKSHHLVLLQAMKAEPAEILKITWKYWTAQGTYIPRSRHYWVYLVNMLPQFHVLSSSYSYFISLSSQKEIVYLKKVGLWIQDMSCKTLKIKLNWKTKWKYEW